MVNWLTATALLCCFVLGMFVLLFGVLWIASVPVLFCATLASFGTAAIFARILMPIWRWNG